MAKPPTFRRPYTVRPADPSGFAVVDASGRTVVPRYWIERDAQAYVTAANRSPFPADFTAAEAHQWTGVPYADPVRERRRLRQLAATKRAGAAAHLMTASHWAENQPTALVEPSVTVALEMLRTADLASGLADRLYVCHCETNDEPHHHCPVCGFMLDADPCECGWDAVTRPLPGRDAVVTPTPLT